MLIFDEKPKKIWKNYCVYQHTLFIRQINSKEVENASVIPILDPVENSKFI